MRAPIQRLWHYVSHLPFPSSLRHHEPIAEPLEAPGSVALGKIAPGFKECENCAPTARHIEAEERDRAERFKRGQLLPIMGMVQPPW